MKSIDLETILTTIYVIIDDWYQNKGKRSRIGKRGCKPTFTDSEVMTLMLAGEFVPYPGELQFIAYIRANYLALFPQLLSQSQFNRRSRQLRMMIEAIRQDWLWTTGMMTASYYL